MKPSFPFLRVDQTLSHVAAAEITAEAEEATEALDGESPPPRDASADEWVTDVHAGEREQLSVRQRRRPR